MTITDIKDTVGIEMDERVWRQLLTLPYKIEADDEGHLVMTPLQEPGLTFEELVTTHPILPNDLAWKVETNVRNQIVMSPPPKDDHNRFGREILYLLDRLMQKGRSFYETGIETENGTRVPDVGWISLELSRANRRRAIFSVAPEICVEIISLWNTRREIDEKKQLYFLAGAKEVWRCEMDGKMNFFDADGALPKSRLCPKFPARIELPD